MSARSHGGGRGTDLSSGPLSLCAAGTYSARQTQTLRSIRASAAQKHGGEAPRACERLGRWRVAPGAGVGGRDVLAGYLGCRSRSRSTCMVAVSVRRLWPRAPRSALSEVRLGRDWRPQAAAWSRHLRFAWQVQRRTRRRRCSRAGQDGESEGRRRSPHASQQQAASRGGRAAQRGRRQPLLLAQRHLHQRRAGRQEGVGEATGAARSGPRHQKQERSDRFTRETPDARAAERRQRVRQQRHGQLQRQRPRQRRLSRGQRARGWPGAPSAGGGGARAQGSAPARAGKAPAESRACRSRSGTRSGDEDAVPGALAKRAAGRGAAAPGAAPARGAVRGAEGAAARRARGSAAG